MNRERALEMVDKLLRLGTSKERHEANLAKRKAQGIIDQHQITYRDLKEYRNRQDIEYKQRAAERAAPPPPPPGQVIWVQVFRVQSGGFGFTGSSNNETTAHNPTEFYWNPF